MKRPFQSIGEAYVNIPPQVGEQEYFHRLSRSEVKRFVRMLCLTWDAPEPTIRFSYLAAEKTYPMVTRPGTSIPVPFGTWALYVPFEWTLEIRWPVAGVLVHELGHHFRKVQNPYDEGLHDRQFGATVTIIWKFVADKAPRALGKRKRPL